MRQDSSRGFCNLQTVDVSRNVLSDIPFMDTTLPKLSKITAHENNISKINAQTAEWALRESAAIDIGNNIISDIALTKVDVNGRNFESLLDSLSKAASLDNVASIGLSSIIGLEGGFSGIINGLRFRKLNTLSVAYGDHFKGDSIPTEIGMLSTLDKFIAFDVGIAGSIPSQLGQLTQLTILNLRGNQLIHTLSAGPTDPTESALYRQQRPKWFHSLSAGPTGPTKWAVSRQQRPLLQQDNPVASGGVETRSPGVRLGLVIAFALSFRQTVYMMYCI